MLNLLRNISSAVNLFHNKVHSEKQVIRLLSNKEIGYLKKTLIPDILLTNLKNAPSVYSLLDLIQSHHDIMNNKHVMQAFRSLFYLQKNERLTATNITSHPSFRTLCLSLKNDVRSFETNEQIEALKILSYVGVDTNSKITQLILQMIRQNVNNLNLKQIIFLDFLLNQFKSTPLSDALLIALPIIFENNLPMKMDSSNLSQLADLLLYAVRNNLSDSTINLITDAIVLNKEINAKAAMSIIWSLCDYRKTNMALAPVFKSYLKILSNSGGNISFSDLETTLTKLSNRYNTKNTFYYNKQFFDYISQIIIENDLGFQQTIWILQKFTKLEYTNNELLDYLTNLCHKNRNLISQTDSWNLFNLTTAFSETDYRPNNWESVRQGILENQNILEDNYKIPWVKFAVRLGILDIFIPQILEKSFQEEYMNKIIENGVITNLKHLLLLIQTISTLSPSYCNLLPKSTYVQKVAKCIYQTELNERFQSFQAALEVGFGGKTYVKANVLTKLGHLLHFVVIMRKGGYPIAYTKEEQPIILEDLQIPPDSHVIVLFCCDSSFYTKNKILKSFYSLMFRTIEASGWSVIPVSFDCWMRLPDFEKIPFLMREVRQKNDEFEKLSAVQY